ncbi:MAG: enamine deaminase RidA (YjgF/YER057c/UK114 family) [Candidatus Azotimanducaceae bacterium]|jgi:enamine deaminase RidA (YjgF/YER057c/UK114 family)
MADQRNIVVPPCTEKGHRSYHFAAGVAGVKAGGPLFCSGQIGVKDGKVASDSAEQFTATFDALGGDLEVAGCTFNDVVDLTTFHIGFPEHLQEFMSVKDRYLKEPWPAWTAAGVTTLAHSDALVEIKVTAELPRA